MQEWELVARERLRDLIARYNLAGDRGWIDEVTELFTPDAVLQIDDVEHVGVDAIRGVFTTATSPAPELIRHFTATLEISVASPEHASARCYFQVLTVHGLDHWGRYTDRFRCVDGSWLFSRRDVRVDGATPGGWAELRGYTGRGGESEHAGRHDVP
jgi:hypothetical protein